MTAIVRMQFGSHVYGTNLPISDFDFKAVHLPDALDILLQRVRPTVSVSTKADRTQKNTADDTDFESFALQKYMALLLEGQTVALTMLFTPDRWLLGTTPLWDEIRANRHLWLHRGVSAFAEYCRQQANKYGIKGSRVAAARNAERLLSDLVALHGPQAKLRDHWEFVEAHIQSEHTEFLVSTPTSHERPVRMISVCNRKVQEHVTLKEAHKIYKHLFDEYGQRALLAERQEGVDWKAMMHALRVCREAEELLLHHTISYPRPEADLLLRVRKGELPYKQVAEMLEDGLVRLEECQRISTLPEKPDHHAAEELVASVYRNRIVSGAAA